MIRKFYDPGVAEPAAAPALSIAEIMAKHGVKNDNESPVATPIDIQPEKKEESTTTEATPVETTTEPPIVEAKTETPTQQAEPIVAAPQKEEQQPVLTLQEVLRQHQPEAILKELGYDDKLVGFVKDLKELDPKMVAFLNTWKSNGDVKEYLRELTTDYSKMPAEDVMRHQLRREYPKASEKALDVLYRKEITEKYNLDSAVDDEVEEGRLLLEAKAERYRDEFISKQNNFLLPKPPEPKVAEPDNSEQLRQQEIEAYRSQITNNAYTKNIIATKNFSWGDGDEKFNFPVDPNVLSGVLFDDNKWLETQYDIQKNPDGSVKSYTPKVEHQLLTAAVAVYGKSFLDAYAQHLKSLGGKAAIAPIDNAKPIEQSTTSPAQAAPKTPAEAMAKNGTLNSGGYR